MEKKDFVLNNYRARKVGHNFFLSTDHGANIFLSPEDFKMLGRGDINDKLYPALEEKGVIITGKNVDKIKGMYRRKFSFLSEGASLHIIIPTLRCNMNCIYCHASSKPHDSNGYDMALETARKTVDFIFQVPSNKITIEFQGGEPLLKFDIVKFIVDYANELSKKTKKEVSFSLVTNLSIMDNEMIDYLASNDINICTSFDGPAEIHDFNRHIARGSNYEQVRKTVLKINQEYKKIKSKRKVNALLTVTSKTLAANPKIIVDEYLNLGFGIMHVRSMNKIGVAANTWPKISYPAEDYIQFWKETVDYMLSLNKKGVKIKERMAKIILQKIFEEHDPNYLELRSPCGAVIGQLAYNYDGKIYSCDEGRMCGNELFMVGDVRNSKYSTLSTCKKSFALALSSMNDTSPSCNICAYKPYCGLCPVCNYAEKGSIITKVPETDRCRIIKAQFDYLLSLLQDSSKKELLLKWLSKD